MKPRHSPIGQIEIDQPIRQLQRLLKTIRQPRLDSLTYRDPVHHNLNVVLVFLVERRGFFDRIKLAVDPYAGEARFLPFGQFAAVFALAPAHCRGEQIGARPFGQGHHPIDHLADGLCRNRQAGGG